MERLQDSQSRKSRGSVVDDLPPWKPTEAPPYGKSSMHLARTSMSESDSNQNDALLGGIPNGTVINDGLTNINFPSHHLLMG